MKYEITGRTESDAATIVLSAGLGGAGAFWQPQIAALTPHFRVVTYDQRGTGRNTEALPDGYTIGHMAQDVIGILDELGIARAHFMGHALGGLVGLEIALQKPDLLDRLILVNAWAKADSHTKRCFAMRKHLLLSVGAEAYVQAQPIFLYPSAWLSQNPERIAREEQHGLAHFQGVDTLLKRLGALLTFDVSARLNDVTMPTLVMAARDDVLVPWIASQALADGLPNAELWLVPEGGHAFTITEDAAFNDKMLAFLG